MGYDHLDVKELKSRGIKIGYTPGVLTEATAEQALAILLATSRRVVESHNLVARYLILIFLRFSIDVWKKIINLL